MATSLESVWKYLDEELVRTIYIFLILWAILDQTIEDCAQRFPAELKEDS